MTALPTRKDEAWRYSDVAALADVWPRQAAERVLNVAAGDNARLDLTLTQAGHDHHVVSLGAGATLTGIIDIALPADAVATPRLSIDLAAGAVARLLVLNHGGRFTRAEFDVTLGDGAEFHLGGVILTDGPTREIVTTVRHIGVGATSRQTIRSIAGGTGTASYLGKVAVARTGQKTDAAQSARALLLGRGATANAKPELEIFADDVKCAHGATVGELDANALFYLASRGVPPRDARALLTRAFARDALEALPEAEQAAAAERLEALL